MPVVQVFNAHRRYRIRKERVQKYVARVVGKRKARISVVFVDSRRCKTINRTFLRHNYVTDVISFCLETTPVLEGEVYVNLDRAKAQAAEYRVSFGNEIARLVVHGSLHLLGYRDDTSRHRAIMKRHEDKHVEYWFPPPRMKGEFNH